MSDESPKIYLLPNLMTAGNLFCGFAAILKILEGVLIQVSNPTAHDEVAKFHMAIWLILASCIFDLLDGRLARLGGNESSFGREFDSLADIVSFGVAPALMVHRVVFHDPEFQTVGWMVASLYLICGALRLARFNCLAAANSVQANKEFRGFPIPAAAGLVASLTYFILWFNNDRIEHRLTRWVLPPLLVFLSWMMFSGFKYPSFKGINWQTKRSMPKFIGILVVIIFTVRNYQWMPFVIFLAYLLYGFLRPFLSRRMKREIEDEIEDEDEEDGMQQDAGENQK